MAMHLNGSCGSVSAHRYLPGRHRIRKGCEWPNADVQKYELNYRGLTAPNVLETPVLRNALESLPSVYEILVHLLFHGSSIHTERTHAVLED